MEIGIDSFAAFLPETSDQACVPASQRMADLLAEVDTADRGTDVAAMMRKILG